MSTKVRINHQIKAPQLRVLGADGENFGVISIEEALKKAEDTGLDLIEISTNATPPYAKIMHFVQCKYQHNKNQKLA